jgi:hypothetical protein
MLAPRTVSATLAVCGCVMLAGCGAATSSGPTTTPATTTTPAGQFNPQLVPSVTNSTTTKTTVTKTKPKTTVTKTKPKASHKAKGRSAPAAKLTPSPTAPAAVIPTPSSSGGVATHTVTVTRTITIIHNHTRTRIVVERPSVPPGAHVPSASAPSGFARFGALGGDVGCQISGGVVRCDISARDWSPPARPSSCHLAWGQGMAVGPSGTGHFVCAGDSVLDPTGPQVPVGEDDVVGSITCQVRSFGVTCFEASGDGFMIGRSGFYTF